MQIGEVIRKYRKQKNMTQEEMANRLGVTAPAVNKWENGNSLPVFQQGESVIVSFGFCIYWADQ